MFCQIESMKYTPARAFQGRYCSSLFGPASASSMGRGFLRGNQIRICLHPEQTSGSFFCAYRHQLFRNKLVFRSTRDLTFCLLFLSEV